MTTVTLYIVTNELGDVTADSDRDAAIERMKDEYYGNILRVTALEIECPEVADDVAKLALPAQGGETIKVEVTE